MSDAVIEVRDVTRTYQMGDVLVHALRGVSLTVERGEFIAIMGASGSGKSTLMNLLGCLDRPTSGSYSLEGVDVSSLDEPGLANVRSRRIGFVFQSFQLLARTSAVENVMLPLFYSGRLGDARARAMQALRALGLAGREQNHPSQLSGGQQQRVAIARALINDPSILLADEPTGNLDSTAATELMNTLRSLNRERGLTIVLVTHEQRMGDFTDRIVTVQDGRIVSDKRLRESVVPAVAEPIAASAPTPRSEFRTVVSFARMALSVAAESIARAKMRSALTMLGIFIGVAALIAMVAIGQGANQAVMKQIESLGSNLVVVMPGANNTGGVRSGFGSASTLRVSDAEAIRAEAPSVAQVSYVTRGSAQAQYGSKNWNTTVTGISANQLQIQNWPLDAGHTISPEEVQTGARVALLGHTVVSNLFGPHENPVGATILVKNVPLRVIGVLSSLGQTGYGRDQDDVIMVPFSTAETKILGVAAPTLVNTTTSIYAAQLNPFGVAPKLTGFVNMIFVQARAADEVEKALEEVKRILETRHRIPPGQLPDFDVRNVSQVAQAREGSSRILAALLATVASISLLVGGIGIMNILLVSVTERTREIGLRMAIGARRIHVLLQFLVESVLLSGIGGVCGILAGIAISWAVAVLAGWPILLSPAAIVGGFIFSAAVGVFFGFYPARRAAGLDPVEALRYE
ncbi:MAG TPA: ABC transporter permease [Myxococcota bacterium]|nr:ABC transporter permease [Myxococcota bacterium]